VTAGRELLAVAGTHGKTTTAAMLAVALAALGPAPRAVVGARPERWFGTNTGSYYELRAPANVGH
jgi:UDP-N-acetylmuramate--alanine ligase